MKYKIKSAIMPLIAANVIFFILQMTVKNFTESFILVGNDVFSRPWILLTSMFLHGGVYHLLVNMYVLAMFGSILEQRIGAKRIVLLYFSSGLLASFLSSFFYARALGASGAIYGVIGALIIIMPGLQLLFFFLIPTPLWLAGIIYVMIDVFGVFFPSGTGNIAHLIGIAFGLGYGLYLKKKSFEYGRRFASKKHLNKNEIEEYLKTGRI